MAKGSVKKNYTKETFKNEQEWLNSRGLGGSSASAILGKNPYMSILELYKAIVMPHKTPLPKVSDAMNYGKKCEPLIRKQYALDMRDKYLIHTPRNYEMYRRIDKPYMTATLDGIIFERKENKKGILEIKTHDIKNKKDESEWKGHIPDNYFIQVLHYMLVMNDCDFVEVVAKLRFFDYSSGRKLNKTEIRYYHIDRYDERIQKNLAYLEKKETTFWEKNVMQKIIPAVKFRF